MCAKWSLFGQLKVWQIALTGALNISCHLHDEHFEQLILFKLEQLLGDYFLDIEHFQYIVAKTKTLRVYFTKGSG